VDRLSPDYASPSPTGQVRERGALCPALSLFQGTSVAAQGVACYLDSCRLSRGATRPSPQQLLSRQGVTEWTTEARHTLQESSPASGLQQRTGIVAHLVTIESQFLKHIQGPGQTF
jgi:hypothetical protein